MSFKILMRSTEVMPETELINDRLRLFKQFDGYYIYLNAALVATFPLSCQGFTAARKKFDDVLQAERSFYQ